MPKRLLLLVGLLVLIAGCSRPRSQAGVLPENARAVVPPLALEPPPVYALIGYRDRLELTSAQVTALDSIARSVRDANSALIDDLEDRAVVTSRAPGVLQVEPDDRPLLNEIRANNRRVLDEVAGVLSEEQRVEVCELYAPETARRPERERRLDAQDDFMRAREPVPDTSNVVRGFSAWPWCQGG